MKSYFKIIVDILMLLLFIYLINYHVGAGLNLHAIFGIIMFVLFMIHNVLNITWYRSIYKGKYNIKRTILTVIDLMLIIGMIFTMVGAVMISRMVFSFSPIPVRFEWRTIHVTVSAWTFFIMAIHLGWHTHGIFNKIERRLKTSVFEYVLYLLYVLLVVTSIISSVKGRILLNLLPENMNVVRYTDGQYYLMTIITIIGICIGVHIIWKALSSFKGGKSYGNSNTK